MRYVLIVLFLIFLMPAMGFAEAPSGIGSIASNLMEPVSVINDFVNTAAMVLGGGFIFASFIKYMQYRQNPLAVPFSTVFWLLILGIVLLLLPLAYKLAYEAPPTLV
jgi:hypothetical protein